MAQQFFHSPFFLQYDDYYVQQNGKQVTVIVEEVEGVCRAGKRSKPYFTFHFNNETHRKDLISKYCSITPGDTVLLLTNSDNTIFVYPEEDIKGNMAAGGFVVLVLLFCAYKGYRSK